MWSDTGRFQWLFDSPILAGAAFGALAPWGLALLTGSRWYLRLRCIFAVTFVAVFIVACVLTQSRGPLFAVLASASVGALVGKKFEALTAMRYALSCIGGGIVVMSLSFGGFSRLALPTAIADRSVSNRWVIWKACLDMLFQQPAGGIGHGEAGYFFSQWYQPDELNYVYSGVFNEYLQLGIERGLFALLLSAWAILVVLFLPFYLHVGCDRKKPNGLWDALAFSAYLSFLVLVIAGLFSVLTYSPLINVLAICNLVIVSVWALNRAIAGYMRWMRLALVSLTASGVCVLILFVVRESSNQGAITVVFEDFDKVRLRKVVTPPGRTRVATILVDRNIMGSLYGKEIRRWLIETETFDEFLIFDPRYGLNAGALSSSSTIILPGSTVRFSPCLDPAIVHNVIILHPTSAREVGSAIAIPSVMYLPKYSEFGAVGTNRSINQTEKFTGALGDSLIGVTVKL